MAGNLFYALGVGMYLQLLFVYAMDLGASRFTIGWLNAVVFASIAAGNIPGAWATHHFRLKSIIVAVWWLTVPAAVSFALAPSWPWLLPGLVLSGLYMANNPAFKSYIWLRSAPGQVARSFTLVFAAYPAGLVVAPLIGGFLAARYGMPTVFWLSAVMHVASSAAVSLIRDTPSQASATPRELASTRHNRTFRRYVLFFLVGFLAVYVGQPFLNPYLAQVHGQGYAALGVFASLAALGAALLTPIGGRVADLRGARMSAAIILGLLLVGAVLLVGGPSWPFWAAAMFLFGGFDAFRFLATGIVGRSFGSLPLPWGYALFDTLMGLPMAGGAVLGGLLFRTGSALPFVLVAVVAAGLLAVLLVWRPAPLAGAGRTLTETPSGAGVTDAAVEGPAPGDAGAG
jgi:predicted MFS family arabinose efflux permease